MFSNKNQTWNLLINVIQIIFKPGASRIDTRCSRQRLYRLEWRCLLGDSLLHVTPCTLLIASPEHRGVWWNNLLIVEIFREDRLIISWRLTIKAMEEEPLRTQPPFLVKLFRSISRVCTLDTSILSGFASNRPTSPQVGYCSFTMLIHLMVFPSLSFLCYS